MINVERGLTKLLTDTVTTAEQVRPVVADQADPENIDNNILTYTMDDGDPNHHMQGAAGVQKFLYTLKTYSRYYSKLKAMQEELDEIDGFTGIQVDVDFKSFLISGGGVRHLKLGDSKDNGIYQQTFLLSLEAEKIA